MLLTELILSKRGPLGKVWLSAHQERKLSKAQTLGIDVEESVEAILEQDEGPTMLRISGQLMLGVTRIYSRKVQYLLDDCKETRERIALAFRPGMVDLPEDQARASRNAITFSDVRNDFDYFDWTWAAPPPELASTTSATSALALRPATKEFGAYNFGRPAAASIYGGSSVSRHPSQDDTSSYLDSQDFSGIDLNLNFDDVDAVQGEDVDMEGENDDASVEAGRRAVRAGTFGSERSAIRAESLGKGSDGLGGEAPFEGEMDLGLDFDAFVDQPAEDARRRRAGSDASSVLSPPPPETPGDITLTEITPRTAARIAQLGPTQAAANTGTDDLLDPATAPNRKTKGVRLTRADAAIELPDAYFAHPGPDAPVWASETSFIPSDPTEVAMQTLMADPGAYFLPTLEAQQGQGGGRMLYAGPMGLADELKELFMFPVNLLRKDRDEEQAAEDRAAKRPRVEGQARAGEGDAVEGQQAGEDGDGADDVEAARRMASLAPDLQDEGMGMGLDDSFAFDANVGEEEPLALDIDMPETPRRTAPVAERYPSLAPSRAESMARQIQYAGESGEFTLAMFDNRTVAGAAGADSLQSASASQSQSQSQQQTPTKSSVAASEARTHGGYSKNTGMAIGLLRRELEVIEAESRAQEEEEEEEKVVRMSELADKASKRAASTFFFELLVLGTRDCVKLEQQEAFGDIEIRAKERLFEEITV